MELTYKQQSIIRFWSKVVIKNWVDCWEWDGSTINHGGSEYGQIKYGNKNLLAHRLVLILNDIAIPKGMDVLHVCDNPKCVNPNHLFFGNHSDNMLDKAVKGRCSRKLSEDQVKIIKSNKGSRGAINSYAKIFNVNRRTIADIYNGKTWRHVTT